MQNMAASLAHPPSLVLAPTTLNDEPLSINSIASNFSCDDEVLTDLSGLFSLYDASQVMTSKQIIDAFLAFSVCLSGVADSKYNSDDEEVLGVLPSEVRASVWLYCRAGSLTTWGSSRHGVLAHGDEQSRPEPAPVSFPRAVLSVAAGNDHMLIQCLDGVYAVGRGAYGQLGLGDNRNDLRTPERIRDLEQTTVLQVACGYWHSLFCTTSGVYVCGWNNHGQLGLGDVNRQQGTPALVDFKGQTATAVAGGAFHSLFLVGGNVYTCGVGASGELGLGDKTDHNRPTLLTTFKGKKVFSVSAGGHRSFVQCSDGVYAFGDNYCGTLGVGDEEPRVVPVRVPTFDAFAGRVMCISSRGGRTSVVVKGVGLFSFGAGENGKLGLGDDVNRSEPVLVPALEGTNVQMTACGYDHSITVCERYVVACGSNQYGELGVGSNAELEGGPAEDQNSDPIIMPGTGILTPPPMPVAPPAVPVVVPPAVAGAAVPLTPQMPPPGQNLAANVHASTPRPVVGLQHCDVLACAAGDGFSAAVFVPCAAPSGLVFASKPHRVVPFESRTL